MDESDDDEEQEKIIIKKTKQLEQTDKFFTMEDDQEIEQ